MTIKHSIFKKQFPSASELIYGCMGLGGEWDTSELTGKDIENAETAIDAATSININFFDLADIYRYGKSELAFGQLLKNNQVKREDIIIQSKCGIRLSPTGTNHYDFSEQWIEHSLTGILERLDTDYLDILMLHRPDILVDTEALNKTLNRIHASGRVRAFGVSNMDINQLQFLEQTLEAPIIANQIELSLSATGPFSYAIQANSQHSTSHQFYHGMFEYAQLNGVELQSWGSLANGLYSTPLNQTDTETVRATKTLLIELASHYNVSKEAILLNFIRKHPAKVRPIIGSLNPRRIKACNEIYHFELSKEHWYALLCSSIGQEVP
jgi:predicted oxidoreductase